VVREGNGKCLLASQGYLRDSWNWLLSDQFPVTWTKLSEIRVPEGVDDN
jgi:hypothetical protein